MSELLVGHILDVDPTDLERASPFVVLVPAIKVSVEVNLKKLGKLSRINLMIFYTADFIWHTPTKCPLPLILNRSKIGYSPLAAMKASLSFWLPAIVLHQRLFLIA